VTHRVTLYGRPGCHLCHEARAALEGLRAEPGTPAFELRELDIESDEQLLVAYLERIPVVALDGVELYDFFVDEEDLRARLREPGRRPAVQ
jgi:glutaredoxin